jgi:translation elongation factor EF-Tu-like GTPase
MKTYSELSDYDLLARVYVIEPKFGGRNVGMFDGYKGQFFWHINYVDCNDWDAMYCFENGSVGCGCESMCKILLSKNVIKYSKGNFPVGSQFGIREGPRIVAVGVIVESKVNTP